MNYNKKGIILGLIFLAAAWAGNILYYNNHVLKEPVFIKHYYDLKNGMNTFQLYYIQNINSDQHVAAITFPELENQYVDFGENDWNSDHRYYKLKIINISLFRATPEDIPSQYKNKLITKAQVHFSDGKVMTVDLGRIYLYNDSSEKPSIFTANASSGSDNTGSVTFRTDGQIKIIGIITKFPELLDNPLKIRINNNSLMDIKFPIELRDMRTFDMNYSFNFEKKDMRNNYVYNFPVDILTEDSNGNRGYGSFFVSHWLQFPEQYDISSLVKAAK